jgi:hypothetical protein
MLDTSGYIGIHTRIRISSPTCGHQVHEELQSAGVDPLLLKDPMGGLIGVLHTMMASKHSPNPLDTYPACIPQCILHGSRMYLDCILIATEDTCIPHVSRMYPACIPSVQDTCIMMYPDCILKCRHDAFKIHVS